MEASIDGVLTFSILLASVEVQGMCPVLAASKTLSEESVKWDAVTERLIEEWRGLCTTGPNHTEVAKMNCTFCFHLSNQADRYSSTPDKPSNRLSVL